MSDVTSKKIDFDIIVSPDDVAIVIKHNGNMNESSAHAVAKNLLLYFEQSNEAGWLEGAATKEVVQFGNDNGSVMVIQIDDEEKVTTSLFPFSGHTFKANQAVA